MLITELGIVTLIRSGELKNALSPMLVTLYVTLETTKDAKIVTSPVTGDEAVTVATPEPTTYS
jgi:hypothetical protein